MLYGCATSTMRTQDFGSLRIARHKLLLGVIGVWHKNRTGYKPLSYGDALERTGSIRIETTIRKSTWFRLGPCSTWRLKTVKANHAWAAGGAKAQARRSTDDVFQPCGAIMVANLGLVS